MELIKAAVDPAKAGKDGVKVFYDDKKTCGAIIKQIGSTEYNKELVKQWARFEKELSLAKGNQGEIEKIQRYVTSRTIAKTVVVKLFGFAINGVEIPSTIDNVTNILNSSSFDSLYLWVISRANDTETFCLDDSSPDWEEIGKKLVMPLDGK